MTHPSHTCAWYPCDAQAYWLTLNDDAVRLSEEWWTCAEHATTIADYLRIRSLGWGTDMNVWQEYQGPYVNMSESDRALKGNIETKRRSE